jgi:hypothetical protein
MTRTGIKGSQIKDDTITGDDVDEDTLVLNHFFNAKYTNTGGSSKIFIRPVDTGSTTNPGVNNRFLVPSSGTLKYVLIRSDSTPGSTEIGFHKSSDGTEDINSTATETQTIDLSTANTVVKATFSNSATFSAHDVIGISVNPTNNHGRVNVIVVFELQPF